MKSKTSPENAEPEMTTQKKTTAKKNPSAQPVFQCEYCSKTFGREKTLFTHMCVKKQRYVDSTSLGSRLGFMAFGQFYRFTTNYREKTMRDFIESPFYLGFARFGNYLTGLKPLYPERFVEFLVKSGIKLDDWTNEEIYYSYLNELLRREPAGSATERSFETIVGWTENHGVSFGEFFKTISPNELSHLIRMGSISPWVVYLSSTGGEAIAGFNEDHLKMVGDTIDAAAWARIFRERGDDVTFVSGLLMEAGI